MDVVWDGVRVEALVDTPLELEIIVEDEDGVPNDAVSLAVTAEVTRLFGVDGTPVEVRMEVL